MKRNEHRMSIQRMAEEMARRALIIKEGNM